jgi:hypothetical protein
MFLFSFHSPNAFPKIRKVGSGHRRVVPVVVPTVPVVGIKRNAAEIDADEVPSTSGTQKRYKTTTTATQTEQVDVVLFETSTIERYVIKRQYIPFQDFKPSGKQFF